jgi:DnaJ-class molecular chaperone
MKPMADPYQVLGLERDATQHMIAAAYRKLAKQLHPDLNPGDKKAEEKFKAVSAAYALLGDPEKRARFDRGEIDATGGEPPRGRYYRDFNDAEGRSHAYGTHAGFADFEDVLSDIFGRGPGFGTRFRMQGEDITYELPLEFLEALSGGTKRITLADGSTLDLRVPPGTRDGQLLRLRAKGGAGAGGGAPGDALVRVRVRPHPYFKRNGDDVEIEVPISLREAVLGALIDVPTPTGGVRLGVPKWANNGMRLRLRGKGVLRPDGSRGDEFAILRIVLPDGGDPELEAFVRRWTAGNHNPRQHLQEAA